jgi:predicted RNA methylase
VAAPDAPAAARLELADLTERQRVAVAAALRWEVIEHRFTAEERADLATGSADLSHVAARALLRAVAALEHDQSAETEGAVRDLADLHLIQKLHIPFDVQTEAYRVRASAPPEVLWRLGFAEGD